MKTAIITGATSGIGWETAVLLAKKGYRVIALGRNRDQLKKLKEKLGNKAEHLTFSCDLTQVDQLKETAQKILDQCEAVDVLINNAGRGLFKAFEDTTEEEHRQLMDLNLSAPMELTKLFLKRMKQQNSGSIVNISSVAGRRTFKNLTSYCASKFGLIGFSNSLRRELKASGHDIQVSVICPPATKTSFFSNAGYDSFEKDHPGLSLATAAEVAEEIWQAIKKKKRQVVVSKRAKILDTIAALFPGFIENLEDFVIARNQKKK